MDPDFVRQLMNSSIVESDEEGDGEVEVLHGLRFLDLDPSPVPVVAARPVPSAKGRGRENDIKESFRLFDDTLYLFNNNNNNNRGYGFSTMDTSVRTQGGDGGDSVAYFHDPCVCLVVMSYAVIDYRYWVRYDYYTRMYSPMRVRTNPPLLFGAINARYWKQFEPLRSAVPSGNENHVYSVAPEDGAFDNLSHLIHFLENYYQRHLEISCPPRGHTEPGSVVVVPTYVRHLHVDPTKRTLQLKTNRNVEDYNYISRVFDSFLDRIATGLIHTSSSVSSVPINQLFQLEQNGPIPPDGVSDYVCVALTKMRRPFPYPSSRECRYVVGQYDMMCINDAYGKSYDQLIKAKETARLYRGKDVHVSDYMFMRFGNHATSGGRMFFESDEMNTADPKGKFLDRLWCSHHICWNPYSRFESSQAAVRLLQQNPGGRSSYPRLPKKKKKIGVGK